MLCMLIFFFSNRSRHTSFLFFFFQAEDGIRDRSPSRGLGDVYKRQHCCCGHHHHHHDHDADEVFTSWGVETAKKFSKADIEHALTELDTGNYGMILRSKGIVDGGTDGWLEFDYVPGEWEVRARGADVGGKLVVLSLIHISEPTRRTPISYAVFCLKKKKKNKDKKRQSLLFDAPNY